MDERLFSLHNKKGTRQKKSIKTDNIVLIQDLYQIRSQWKFGNVVEVFLGKDRKLRKVFVVKRILNQENLLICVMEEDTLQSNDQLTD